MTFCVYAMLDKIVASPPRWNISYFSNSTLSFLLCPAVRFSSSFSYKRLCSSEFYQNSYSAVGQKHPNSISVSCIHLLKHQYDWSKISHTPWLERGCPKKILRYTIRRDQKSAHVFQMYLIVWLRFDTYCQISEGNSH